jgi:hypothetical protein
VGLGRPSSKAVCLRPLLELEAAPLLYYQQLHNSLAPILLFSSLLLLSLDKASINITVPVSPSGVPPWRLSDTTAGRRAGGPITAAPRLVLFLTPAFYQMSVCLPSPPYLSIRTE